MRIQAAALQPFMKVTSEEEILQVVSVRTEGEKVIVAFDSLETGTGYGEEAFDFWRKFTIE